MTTRSRKLWLSIATIAFLLTGCAGGCSKKSMSDREANREQLRVDAEIKRRELTRAAGEFHGEMMLGDVRQDVSLLLEMKDVPDTSAGSIDPVLIPVVAGSVRMTYGPRADGGFIAFAVERADFEPNSGRLDLVAQNEVYKDLVLALERTATGYTGTWTSPASSSSGAMAVASGDALSLQPTTPELGGEYDGLFVWSDGKTYQHAALSIALAQGLPDRFTLTGNLRLSTGNPGGGESLLYPFDAVEFNPFTRTITMRSGTTELAYVGSVAEDGIRGAMTSKLLGDVGSATFRRGKAPEPPAGAEALPAITGAYYASIVDENPQTRLPPRALVTLIASSSNEDAGNLGITGNLRLYYGNYGGNEFLELPFSHVELRLFSRQIVLKTADDPKLTLTLSLDAAGVTGRIQEDTYGEVGILTGTRIAPQGEPASLAGDYRGYFDWDAISGYQTGTLTLTTSLGGTDALRLRGTVTLLFGDVRVDEKLVYVFDAVSFDPMTGYVAFGSEDSEITLKGHLDAGTFEGEWISARRGRMGAVRLALAGTIPVPTEAAPMTSLEGNFAGTIVSTNPQASLPESMTLGLVTSPDLSSQRGLKVEGSMRLYLSEIDSDEYFELDLRDVQYDVYSRQISGRAEGQITLTLKGSVGASMITGTLEHANLGEVARFEVTKR